MQHVDVGDGTPYDVELKATPDGLDLGQFGHGLALRGPRQLRGP
jgi:hypothetical protein